MSRRRKGSSISLPCLSTSCGAATCSTECRSRASLVRFRVRVRVKVRVRVRVRVRVANPTPNPTPNPDPDQVKSKIQTDERFRGQSFSQVLGL